MSKSKALSALPMDRMAYASKRSTQRDYVPIMSALGIAIVDRLLRVKDRLILPDAAREIEEALRDVRNVLDRVEMASRQRGP